MRIPTVNKISKEFYALIKELPKKEIFTLCETLWESGYSEESYIACNWSYYLHAQYEPEDFDISKVGGQVCIQLGFLRYIM